MELRSRTVLGLLIACAAAFVFVGGATAHDDQHGPLSGHLIGTGAFGNIEFVGNVRMHDASPEVIADLAVFGNYAYLARWGAPDCAGNEKGGQNTPDGGVYVVDISNPAQPREVGFIATSQDTLVGEGVQVVRLATTAFTGDVLLMNHEGCGKNYKAGVSLWDVSDPLKPVKLSEHFGDRTIGGAKSVDRNQTHSAFMWNAGGRAFLVATDDEESTDVDIYEITNPRKPKLVGEFDLNVHEVAQPSLALTDSFLHDMVVKEIGGKFIMLLSYWDGGWVLLDVANPASPVFLGDSDYPAVDPELLEQTGVALSPEGNAHQAEFTRDNRYVIGTGEDFDPFRLIVTTVDGGFRGSPGTQTTVAQAEAVKGTTVFVGRACPGDPVVPPAPNVGASQIAVVERGLCFFEDKAQAVLAAGGYEAMLIMNREGADACTGVLSPSLDAAIPTIFVGRDTGFAIFNRTYDQTACADATQLQSGIPIGTIGDPILSVTSQFDGWGYVHLFAVNPLAGTFTEKDTFAIPEAMNPAFAMNFGSLSVHEVATDPQNATRAYLSYYNGGMRALKIEESAGACAPEPAPCLRETGGYLDPLGNNFWGIEAQVRNGRTYIFGSDMDYGLFVFRAAP